MPKTEQLELEIENSRPTCVEICAGAGGQAIGLDIGGEFSYPAASGIRPPTVGETLFGLMSANGWEGAAGWKDKACKIAPTVVGGSKKHGGPDLGPARARKAWAELGIDGRSVANEAPEPGFGGMPRLTKEMLSRLQGFPDRWNFGRRKTLACRMIGNAFPPPVAKAVGCQIRKVLEYAKSNHSQRTRRIP